MPCGIAGGVSVSAQVTSVVDVVSSLGTGELQQGETADEGSLDCRQYGQDSRWYLGSVVAWSVTLVSVSAMPGPGLTLSAEGGASMLGVTSGGGALSLAEAPNETGG